MLRVDTERRFLPRFKKSGFGAAERIKSAREAIEEIIQGAQAILRKLDSITPN
jgi:hypothetical protein